MNNYYFLATALPPLQLGISPELSFEEFQDLLKDNLSAHDYEQTEVIRRFYDIQNIRAFWKKEPLDPRGNLNEVELEEALLAREGFPDYVYEFLDLYESTSKRLEHFPALLGSFFKSEEKQAVGFLKEYLRFEREWRLVFTGLRAKELGRECVVELQFEDPNDDLVAQILAQKDSKTFISPEGYEQLTTLFEENVSAPVDLYKALCAYRFHRIEQMLAVDLFSLDRILGYMVQLIIIEEWVAILHKSPQSH